MSILITGGAGYIGSHIINLLNSNTNMREEIIVIDDLSNGKKENISGCKLIPGDLSDLALLENIFASNEIEVVIHLAGSIVVSESIRLPELYYANNTLNTLNLLNLCLKYNVSNFIFSSTAAVYGNAKHHIVDEEAATNPITPYGRSKLMIEWMLKDLSNAHNFHYIAFRYFNVAGASANGQIGTTSKHATHLIKILSEIAAGKRDSFSLFGDDYQTPDGSCIRDFIHIDDLAQAHILAIDYLRRNKQSHVLNCGYGHGFSVKEVLEATQNIMGKKINWKVEARREGDIAALISANHKIKKILQWQPKYDNLNFILKSSIDWEKANK